MTSGRWSIHSCFIPLQNCSCRCFPRVHGSFPFRLLLPYSNSSCLRIVAPSPFNLHLELGQDCTQWHSVRFSKCSPFPPFFLSGLFSPGALLSSLVAHRVSDCHPGSFSSSPSSHASSTILVSVGVPTWLSQPWSLSILHWQCQMPHQKTTIESIWWTSVGDA